MQGLKRAAVRGIHSLIDISFQLLTFNQRKVRKIAASWLKHKQLSEQQREKAAGIPCAEPRHPVLRKADSTSIDTVALHVTAPTAQH